MRHHVNILRSKTDKKRIYIGYTTNLKQRMEQHSNPEKSSYTRQYAPWELEAYLAFKDRNLAKNFEVYLKSQSGRAFLRKRMIKT